MPNVPTYIRRVGSTSLLALDESRAAGVVGQDMGTVGRLVREGGEDKGGAAVAAMTAVRYDDLLSLPHSHLPIEPLNFLTDSCSDISLC